MDDVCPFHDLPPGSFVQIHVGNRVLPTSAEVACDEWHLAKVFDEWCQRAWTAALKAPIGDVEHWVPEGLRNTPSEGLAHFVAEARRQAV